MDFSLSILISYFAASPSTLASKSTAGKRTMKKNTVISLANVYKILNG
jgi:hypothetical protein